MKRRLGKMALVLLSLLMIFTLTACGAKTLPIDEYAKTVDESFDSWLKNMTLWAQCETDGDGDKAAQLSYIAECRKYLDEILAVKTDDGEYIYCCNQIIKGAENEFKWCDAAEKLTSDPKNEALLSELEATGGAETTLPSAMLELFKKYREETGKSISDL